MTFKEFRHWCSERACDGCWGLVEARICIWVIQDILKTPRRKREKDWQTINDQIERDIVNPINQKIREMRGHGHV